MKASFPTNYEELVRDLLAQGSFSFEVKIENKEKFLRALDRCRRHKSLWPQPDSIFGRLKWFFYGLYTIILNSFAFRNDKGGSSAVTYFDVASDYISSVEGRDFNETTTITYVART